jgi:arginyl-tRNA synthetase
MCKMKVVVDFSSPNIAQEMHVGHLRSTIIGDAICRVLEFCGHEVLRTNHVGDWGTEFGMLITYLQEAFPDILTSPPNITDLTAIYKASKKRFDEDEDFKQRARLNVVSLQRGDVAARAIWNLLCDISRAEFQKVYDLLGVKLTEVGESFYNPLIPGVIAELQGLGLLRDEEGMLVLMMNHFTIPLILRKSDGGYGYDSTDMGAISYRIREVKSDWVIYITDSGQASHFHMIFDAAREAKWIDPVAHRLDHIGFGVVCGDDGKRFKTRSSETVRLIDLLDAAKDRMQASLQSRADEGKTPLQGDEVEAAARVIGYGAVKYFDLKQHPSTDYIFSYDRMLDTKGDTAVYLLFAYARVASILRKAAEERQIDVNVLAASATSIITIQHPAERALAFELLQFGDVVTSTLDLLLPNRLCEYLYQLAVKFTDFVTKCHVLNAPETNSRLLLCVATKRLMSTCFDLLGIGTLERI